MDHCEDCPHKAQCRSYNAINDNPVCIIHEPVHLERLAGDLGPCGGVACAECSLCVADR